MNTTIRVWKGEDLAAESYQKQGFTILKRNYRFGRAEVDIIANRTVNSQSWRSNGVVTPTMETHNLLFPKNNNDPSSRQKTAMSIPMA